MLSGVGNDCDTQVARTIADYTYAHAHHYRDYMGMHLVKGCYLYLFKCLGRRVGCNAQVLGNVLVRMSHIIHAHRTKLLMLKFRIKKGMATHTVMCGESLRS